MVADAVEAFPPAAPTLAGFRLLDRPYGLVRDFLLGLDANLIVDEEGAKSLALGVSISDPSGGDDPGAPPASIFVFSDGYWERPLAALVDELR